MHVVVEVSGEANLHLCSNNPDDLVAVETSSKDYSTVRSLFMDNWKHSNKARPTIYKILYVAYSGPDALAHLSRFSSYSNKVGNTQLLFHGTNRLCRAGMLASSMKLCTRSDCSLCNILRGSYDIEKARSRRMFGNGIYSTNVSSKADYYTTPNSTDGLKCVILNHVVLGRTTLMTTADQSLQHAPDIFNSVTGATKAQGGQLEFHEAIVYREDAMCPCAVILYK